MNTRIRIHHVNEQAWNACVRVICSTLFWLLCSPSCSSSAAESRRLTPQTAIGDPPISTPPVASGAPIFRDDFTGELKAAWIWQNEDARRHRVSRDGWLEITGGDSSILAGRQQPNLLWVALPEGTYEISIHLKSRPLFDFQRAGLLLYQDARHYISLSLGHCLQCVLGGRGIFLEFNLNGNRGKYAAPTDATDLYLRLLSEHGAVSAFYAAEAGQWQHIASLQNDIGFEYAALSVTNDSIWDTGYDLVGLFDYFEIRRPTEVVPTPAPGSYYQA